MDAADVAPEGFSKDQPKAKLTADIVAMKSRKKLVQRKALQDLSDRLQKIQEYVSYLREAL
ncbi:Hypothetical predicted protein [Podarcis lilfordi]|uniref:Uncharacterized protein n=1 Tax=Podarcis lilfordi TaxID=74358 RepID=A0AA35KTD9_9SAUR|nr:Hypothetical predicted protein [Podarcis lilfordi]